MNSILYTCVSLAGTSKVGNLKKTDDGYYQIIVGALNVFNSAGAYYPYEAAKSLFEESSQLQRRIKRGALRGEYGHPVRQPGMTADDFASRCMTISENDVCCHHRSIKLDFDNVKDENGRPVIAIISELMPSGPKGEYLRRSLDNPSENVCFSVRSFTQDTIQGGIKYKAMRSVVTWDYVNEPGIAMAEKFKSPALETHVSEYLTRGTIERVIKAEMAAQVGMGVESSSVLLSAQDLFNSMGWVNGREIENTILKAPGWKGW